MRAALLALLFPAMAFGQTFIPDEIDTVCSGNNWSVFVDGVALPNTFQLETTMSDAMDNAQKDNPDALITSSINRTCRSEWTWKEVVGGPVPDPPVAGTIEIPGSVDWVPVDFGVVKSFQLLEDTYGVASDNSWLYVFKVGQTLDDVYLVNRPPIQERNSLEQSETTALTDGQIVSIIERIASAGT